MKRLVALLMSIVFFSPALCLALDQEEKTHKLEEIVVTSTSKEKMLYTPTSISIITADEMEAMGAKNVVEALRRLPGVDDTSSRNAAISIRGTKSSMTGGPVILIDGVPQKVGDYRYDELSFIPVSQVERIEVLRSAGSAYGPGAARGVINVITKKSGKEPFSGDVSGSYGSWKTTNVHGEVSGNLNQWDFYANATNYSTDGYEEEKQDRFSTLLKFGYNPSDSTRIGARFNYIENDHETADGFSKLDWQLEEYRTDIHFPKSETDSTLIWHNEKEQDIATVALDFSHKSHALYVDSFLSYTGYKEFYTRSKDLYVKPANVYEDDKDQDTWAFALSGGYAMDFGKAGYTPRVGVDYENIDFGNDRTYPYNPGKNTDKYVFDLEEEQYGLFLDNDFLFAERYALKIGGRLDTVRIDFRDRTPTKVDQDETMFSWQVAPSWHVSDKATLYASAARNYWFPSPRYYAWAAEKGGEYNRPEDLKPEENLTFEIGYKHLTHKALNINVTGYFVSYKDKFGTFYHPSSTRSLGQKNMGDAEGKGVELEVDGRITSLVGYRLSGAYQEIEWTSGTVRVYDWPSNNPIHADLDGNQIYHTPKVKAVVGLDFFPMEALTCSVDVNYTGKKYIDYLNRLEYPEKTTVDARISYRWKDWKFWVLGKNIFDEEIEYVSNQTGRLTGAGGDPKNYYFVQDGAYFEFGVGYHF